CSIQWCLFFFLFFSSRRRHTRSKRDWSSDVCSSDLGYALKIVPFDQKAAFCFGKETGEKKGVRITFPKCRVDVGAALRYNIKWRSEERRVGKECRSGWAR